VNSVGAMTFSCAIVVSVVDAHAVIYAGSACAASASVNWRCRAKSQAS
jgi:hypothetical protein